MAREDFISQMLPYAIAEGQRIGIDPRIIVAQAALETGWGRSAPGNNYFGIKSHGQGGGNTFSTNEVINGQTVRIRDSFRAYPDMASSVRGYADFLLENPRYGPMLSAEGIDAQIAALGQSGYATDPEYANKIRQIAAGIALDGVAPISPPAPAQGGQAQPSAARPQPLATMGAQSAPARPQGAPGLMQRLGVSPERQEQMNGVLAMLAQQPEDPSAAINEQAIQQAQAARIAWARQNGWRV